jgi:hypothetical protein
MTPRMNGGIIGTSVGSRYSMISLMAEMAIAKVSFETENVRYCCPWSSPINVPMSAP